MSMYQMVFGRNPGADDVLSAVGLKAEDVQRFRDAWIERTEEGGYRAAIYTRMGGGHRECFCEEYGDDAPCMACRLNAVLNSHPLFSHREDDDFDSTYSTLYFHLPETPEAIAAARNAVPHPIDTDERWLMMLEALKGAAS